VLIVQLNILLVLFGQQLVFEETCFKLEGPSQFNPLQECVVEEVEGDIALVEHVNESAAVSDQKVGFDGLAVSHFKFEINFQ
jgi:hypothetical protein